MKNHQTPEARSFPHLRRMATVGLSIILTAACADTSAAPVTENAETPEHVTKCDESYRRPLPTPTDVQKVHDDRQGDVYACWYFMDMGVPFNTPTLLHQMDVKTVESSTFKLRGNLGGFAILGFGALDGQIAADGKTEQTEIVTMAITDSDGYRQRLIIPESETKVKVCEDECPATVEFVLSNEKLWNKKRNGGASWTSDKDNSSIWRYDSVNKTADDNNRLATVSQVAVKSPNDEGDSYNGGPATFGRVASALAKDIIITLPTSAFENSSVPG